MNDIMVDVVLPLILAFIMFSMGLDLVADDFKRVFKIPKAFLTGLVNQMIILPLVCFLLLQIWPIAMSPAIAVGFMIIAACPGGSTSNLLTHLAKGDTALSISLTAVVSIISVFTVPLIVNFGLEQFMGRMNGTSLSLGSTTLKIFAITTLPVGIGMLVKKVTPDLAQKLEPRARVTASVLFVAIVLGAVAKYWKLLMANIGGLAPFILLLNIVMMAIGFMSSKAIGVDHKSRISIALETGIQNGTLAIFIGGTLLGSPEMFFPGAVYGILMYFTAFGFIFLLKKKQS